MQTISTKAVGNLIRYSDGRIFTVTFFKKNGDRRILTGRKGVKKGVKGVGLAYEPKDHGLHCVAEVRPDGGGDFEGHSFRMVTEDNITALSIAGETFQVA